MISAYHEVQKKRKIYTPYQWKCMALDFDIIPHETDYKFYGPKLGEYLELFLFLQDLLA